MTPTTRRKLINVVQKFYSEVCDLGCDFPQTWADGFLNVIAYDQTNHDDDNSYDRSEDPAYSNYKKGATAAMILLKCPGANAN